MKSMAMIFVWLIVLIAQNNWCYAQIYDSLMLDSCWQGKIYSIENDNKFSAESIILYLKNIKADSSNSINNKIESLKQENIKTDSSSLINNKMKSLKQEDKKITINLEKLIELSECYINDTNNMTTDSIIYKLLYANAFQNKNQSSYNLYMNFLDSLYYNNLNISDTLIKAKTSKLMLIASLGVGLNDINVDREGGCESNFNFEFQKKANRLYGNYKYDLCCHCFLIHPLTGNVEWTQQDLNRQLNCLFLWLSNYNGESLNICCLLMLRSRFFSEYESLEEIYNGRDFYGQ